MQTLIRYVWKTESDGVGGIGIQIVYAVCIKMVFFKKI